MNSQPCSSHSHGSILVQICNLHKSFTMGHQTIEVLRGIDLEIARGEMLAIVGASGAGKSTLLHIIGTLDRPTSGTVLFEKQDVFRFKERTLAEFRNRRIGFVFQFHHLLPEFTALENTFLPALIHKRSKEEARAKAEALLTEVGLGHRLHHKPGELSGGEQQRVAIARALVQKPDLVLADEPTGNLDSHTGDEVFSILRELNHKHGSAIVMVTHNEQLSHQSDRLIHVQDGGIL